jgi:hypothetical protein
VLMEGNTNTQACICLYTASSTTWSGLGKNFGYHGEIKAARPTGFVFVSVQNPPLLHGNQLELD